MEAGKERLTRDTVRDATRQEIEHLKRENYGLKQLAADLSLEVHRFKTRPSRLWTMAPAHERPGEGGRHNPGGTDPVGKRRLPAQLQVPRSTYSRWRACELQGKQDSSFRHYPGPLEQAQLTRGGRSIGGGQGVSGVEQPAAGRLGHRPPEAVGG